MALAPVLPEAAFSGALLFWLLSWAVALGMAWIWRNTLGEIFQGIAKALTFKLSVGWGPSKTVHLGGWAKTIDHAAMSLFTDWAVGAEIMVGKTWHAMATMFWAMSHAISDASAATLDFGHYIIHHAIPDTVESSLRPWRNKTNGAAAAVAAAAAALAALKKVTRAEHRAEQAASAAAQSAARAAAHDATQAKTQVATVEHAVINHTKVITQVIDVPALPIPFGRTAKQLWRLTRKHEAIIGATVFAAAMANVLGLPNPRCLTKGPVGRFARKLCGLSSNALEDLLGLIADVVIFTDICKVIDLLNEGLSVIEGPLEDFVSVVGGALCHGDFDAPPVIRRQALSLPPVTGIVLSLG